MEKLKKLDFICKCKLLILDIKFTDRYKARLNFAIDYNKWS